MACGGGLSVIWLALCGGGGGGALCFCCFDVVVFLFSHVTSFSTVVFVLGRPSSALCGVLCWCS